MVFDSSLDNSNTEESNDIDFFADKTNLETENIFVESDSSIDQDKSLLFIEDQEIPKKEVIEAQNSQDDIIELVNSGEIELDSSIKKGNYGEMITDRHYEKNGYDRISLDRVTDIADSSHQGLDGVYQNKENNSDYRVVESKFGSSTLSVLSNGTPQMSEPYISDRLESAVGTKKYIDIMMNGYTSELSNIDIDGNISICELNENGEIIN